MNKITLYLFTMLFLFSSADLCAKQKKKGKEISDREMWYKIMYRMAAPVLSNMSEGKLQENMQLELSPTWDGRDKRVSYMECFGRLMAGVAPWLSLPDDDSAESKQRKQLRIWALKSYKNAVDPSSPDYLLWSENFQTLVDAAYIAESFIRGYDSLWMPLDSITKERYITQFISLRRINPLYTNWLLFTSTIEAFLHKVEGKADYYRIDSALRKVSDGTLAMDGIRMGLRLHSTIIIVLSFTLCYSNAWKYLPMAEKLNGNGQGPHFCMPPSVCSVTV